MAILSILEKDAIKLGKKAVEMALAGDNTALKLCLERLAPPSRERSLQISIPMPESPADVPETLRAILRSATDGSITISEAERLARCVEVFARAYELADFDARLKALEARDA